jgi:AcrR family transcriptional regulator
MPRNRQLTEERIRVAGVTLLRERGFEDWGINAVARQAGTDKVLIYRYFQSLDGLLEAIVAETAFWPGPESLPDSSPEAAFEATRAFIKDRPEAFALLTQPAARRPVSPVLRRYSNQLDAWVRALLPRVRGPDASSALRRAAALLYQDTLTGEEEWSPADIWRTVSPPLEWIRGDRPEPDSEDLPTELL